MENTGCGIFRKNHIVTGIRFSMLISGKGMM